MYWAALMDAMWVDRKGGLTADRWVDARVVRWDGLTDAMWAGKMESSRAGNSVARSAVCWADS